MTALLLSEHSVTSLDVVHHADALAWLRGAPSNWLNCVVTSPPYYGLRDYSASGQIGLEDTPEQYVARLVALFREVRRVMRDDSTVWLNLGDTYLPGKQLAGIPWRVALAMQADGWYLRSDIIWHKPNPQPEPVTDRPTKAHEYVFLLTKSERYWYDADAAAEPYAREYRDGPGFGGLANRRETKYSVIGNQATGPQAKVNTNGTRNRRTVWTVPTEPKPFAHFAMYPQALIEPMILAGCPVGGVVYDPFMGSGTTALVAQRLGRHFVGTDINREYVELARTRIRYRGDDRRMVREQEADVEQLSLLDTEAA